MTPVELAIAIAALLVTPGPTNTLLAVAGAERGWTRAIRLIPAELGGYLATTVPLALLGSRVLDALPSARAAITVLAAGWVLWLALAMWHVPRARTGDVTVTARRVAITTILNPKGLIFGLVLLPAGGMRLPFNFGLFAAEVVGIAMLWAFLGSTLRRDAQAGLPTPWRRAASVWLGALGLYLLSHVAGLA